MLAESSSSSEDELEPELDAWLAKAGASNYRAQIKEYGFDSMQVLLAATTEQIIEMTEDPDVSMKKPHRHFFVCKWKAELKPESEPVASASISAEVEPEPEPEPESEPESEHEQDQEELPSPAATPVTTPEKVEVKLEPESEPEEEEDSVMVTMWVHRTSGEKLWDEPTADTLAQYDVCHQHFDVATGKVQREQRATVTPLFKV